jgi:phage portal protein BeeE
MLSKLKRGNTYVLKERDQPRRRGRLYMCSIPRGSRRSSPTTARCSIGWQTTISGFERDHRAGARDHPRPIQLLFHPLGRVSPIYASGLAATQGSTSKPIHALLFQQCARPGGVLTAPGQHRRARRPSVEGILGAELTGAECRPRGGAGRWSEIREDGLTAVEGQMIEQLKWTAEVVCSTYHVPPYKIGVGALPSYNNVQALNVEYYSQCAADPDRIRRALPRRRPRRWPRDDRHRVRSRQVCCAWTACTQMDVLEKSKGKPSPPPPPPPAPDAERSGNVIDLWTVRQRAKGHLDARLRRAG